MPWVRTSTARPAAATPPSAAPAAAPSPEYRGGSLALPSLSDPSETQRQQVEKVSTDELIDAVKRLKDVGGTGTEGYSKGDPRISTRRVAVAALIASNDAKVKAALEALGPNVQADVKWVEAAERCDVQPTDQGGFWYVTNETTKSSHIEAMFQKRVAAGIERARAFESGEAKFLEAADNGVFAVAAITDPAKRTAALADLVLQFRGRTDKAISSAPMRVIDDERIERQGPAMVAEQRIALASLDFSKGDDAALRDFALAREMIASHPASSANAIYEARNAVAKIFRLLGGTSGYDGTWVRDRQNFPPGATCSPYQSIHHNFSRDTPKNIDAFIAEWVYPVGPRAERGPVFAGLVDALGLARKGDVAAARQQLDDLAKAHPESVKPVAKAVASASDAKLGDELVKVLEEQCTKDLGKEPEEVLVQSAKLYEAVCGNRVTADELGERLYLSGAALPQIADVLVAMKGNNPQTTLKELGEARMALRDAIIDSKTGFERQQLIRFDADMNRLACEELGAAVDRVSGLKTEGQRVDALLALRSALQCSLASGLSSIRDDNDPAAKKGERLEEVLAHIDEAFAKGAIDEEPYRELMADAYEAVRRTVQNLRSFFDGRAGYLSASGTPIDPEFADQLVKQSGLHYATALAEQGMRVGLTEDIGPRSISNVEGMRVLNGIGPVVFPSVVFAANAKDLAALNPPRDALCVVYESDEKKMKMAGGLLVDVKDAPGGNSHLNMYAMNNGIPVAALPELSTRYAEFFKNASAEGGVYVDDSRGQFRMMTLGLAKEKGLVTDESVKELLPGTNRVIDFLVPKKGGEGFEVFATHEAIIAPTRPTRRIELYVPQREVKGVGKSCTSFTDLSKLGTLGRHLAGEKGLVLALLKGNPELSPYVPDGSIVTTGRVRTLLEDAGLGDEWSNIWLNDPNVGRVDDDNFTQSSFYTDYSYRDRVRSQLSAATEQKLTKHLIATGADGTKSLTEAGRALYQELAQNPALAKSDNWIARSSFTGEDRPGKSGAGQYESYPNLKDEVARIEGVIGVITSAWDSAPIENNVAEEVNLQHIMPSVVVQHCLKPDQSGVIISRDLDSGARGTVSYQLVKGFGGGVEGGKTEEGRINASGATVTVHYPGEEGGLVPAESLPQLRDIVLKTEQFFNDVVEPGKGHAVDMEVARVGGQWQIVQARVILMDR